jgi:hypothetical protein
VQRRDEETTMDPKEHAEGAGPAAVADEPAAKKLPYESPHVRVLGSVSELTLNRGCSSGTDNPVHRRKQGG